MTAGVEADRFNLADMAFTPARLDWATGDFAARVAETTIAPTGGYDLDKAVNLGRHYRTFDTTAAITYFNFDTDTNAS